jgi:hypothetical protein
MGTLLYDLSAGLPEHNRPTLVELSHQRQSTQHQSTYQVSQQPSTSLRLPRFPHPALNHALFSASSAQQLLGHFLP